MRQTLLKRTICHALVIMVLSAMMISAVAAAARVKPGSNKTGAERCWVTPTPVNDGMQYYVTGVGFVPGLPVSIFVGDGSILMGVTDSVGIFSSWDWASFRTPATITVNVYPSGDRRMTLLATCSFQANGS